MTESGGDGQVRSSRKGSLAGWEGITEGGYSSLDGLAKGMSEGGITRGQMLKFVGALVLGGVLSTALPGVAGARRKKRHRRRRQAGSGSCIPIPVLGICLPL